MEIFKASRQWSTRPTDERFQTLQEMHTVTKAYAETSAEADVPFSTLRAEAKDGEVVLVGKENQPAKLTNWSFKQLSQRAGAPAAYLADLPATLAVQNLNHGLKVRAEDGNGRDMANLLMHMNGGMLCRSIVTDVYTRIWNHEIVERLMRLEQHGWKPRLAGVTEDMENPDLYASDHDMFVFLINEEAVIREAGTDQPLHRGIIVRNSEVGDGALKLGKFLFRRQCCNHIIWNAEDVVELSVRHVGQKIAQRLSEWHFEVLRYGALSASDEEAKIVAAKSKTFGATKEEVLNFLFSKRSLNISRKVLEAGYDATLPDVDGSPNTAWGIAQGLTRYSQTLPFADKRNEIDRAAGRVLKVAF
jgi:hypothetical protein